MTITFYSVWIHLLKPIGLSLYNRRSSEVGIFIQRARSPPLMLTRYISSELTDQRGSSRASEVQPIMVYQNRQVVFIPNFCHRRASISSNSSVRLSALKALPNCGALRALLFCGGGNHVDLRGLPGGGRSPAKPVSQGRFSLSTGKKQGNFIKFGRYRVSLTIICAQFHNVTSKFPVNWNRE